MAFLQELPARLPEGTQVNVKPVLDALKYWSSGKSQDILESYHGFYGASRRLCGDIATESSPEVTVQTGTTTGEDEGQQSQLCSMLAGCNRLISPAPWTSSFYGALSEVSFILRTLELFDRGAYSPQRTLGPITEMFNLSLPARRADRLSQSQTRIPLKEITHELLGSLFGRSHTFLSFLREQHFRNMVDILYNQALTPDDMCPRFLPLFHHVVALGYLFCRAQHQAQTCSFALDQAMAHFQTGQQLLDICKCDDLMSIQALLCGSVFLLSTSRITAAHALIGVAVSSAMRLGFRGATAGMPQVTEDERQMRVLVFAALARMDLYASLVLDLPRFIGDELVDGCINAVQDTLTEGGQNSPGLDVSIKYLELLRFSCSARQAVFFDQSTGESVEVVDTKKLSASEAELHSWTKDVSLLLSQPRDSTGSAMQVSPRIVSVPEGMLVLTDRLQDAV